MQDPVWSQGTLAIFPNTIHAATTATKSKGKSNNSKQT